LAKVADILEIAESALPAGRRLEITLFHFLNLLNYFFFQPFLFLFRPKEQNGVNSYFLNHLVFT